MPFAASQPGPTRNERYALAKTRQGLSPRWVPEQLARPVAGDAQVEILAAGKVQGKWVRMCRE